MPKVYLDRQAMAHHHFIDGENTTMDVHYNLVFSEITHDVIPLPAPALFDPVARGGYRIMPADIMAYRNMLRLLQRQGRSLSSWMSGCLLLRIPTTIQATDRLLS